MASTERGDEARIQPLNVGRDIAAALLLSESASWNQNEADWRTMLAIGRGWGIPTAGADGVEGVDGVKGAGHLAASVVIVPYGSEFAWISMVLVLPAFRRRGYASRLLRHALADLREHGMGGILDATPAGHAVYLEEGFADAWGLRRYRREASAPCGGAPITLAPPPAPPDAMVLQPRDEPIAPRPLREGDWPAILAIDRPAFGGDRETLLRALAARLPEAAWVAGSSGQLRGFVFGRDGREASQIGPLVADDPALARCLLKEALHRIDGPVQVDLADRHESLLPWLESHGFREQRAFMRMVRGVPEAPGNPALVVLVAGPEFG